MRCKEREITKEIYDRAMAHNGHITDEDKKTIFTMSELCGYGVYGATAIEKEGKYYCSYLLGGSCD